MINQNLHSNSVGIAHGNLVLKAFEKTFSIGTSLILHQTTDILGSL
jgi:hypothetical protein